MGILTRRVWTLQQLREAIPSDHTYRFLIHDRDGICSAVLDKSIRNLGLRVLKSPYRSPLANCFCERVIGTLRRECLDYLTPLGRSLLHRIVKEWACYYNPVALAYITRLPHPAIIVDVQL
jgi:hypothetical protein